MSLIVLTICYCLSGQLKSLLYPVALSQARWSLRHYLAFCLFLRRDFNMHWRSVPTRGSYLQGPSLYNTIVAICVFPVNEKVFCITKKNNQPGVKKLLFFKWNQHLWPFETFYTLSWNRNVKSPVFSKQLNAYTNQYKTFSNWYVTFPIWVLEHLLIVFWVCLT